MEEESIENGIKTSSTLSHDTIARRYEKLGMGTSSSLSVGAWAAPGSSSPHAPKQGGLHRQRNENVPVNFAFDSDW
jgi:hypothetical protein